MSLNITTLATRWGKIFGGMNQYDTFRGTTQYTRADTVDAQFADYANQRLVTDGLYTQTRALDQSMNSIVSFYMTMARNTLIQMCRDDVGALNINDTDAAVLSKLITDMLSTANTFQRPTVTINSGSTANGTAVTTPQGAPTGNGVIVGTLINPRTCINYYYPYVETLKFVCNSDSYTSGVSPGQESFAVTAGLNVNYEESRWPQGSGVNTVMSSIPTSSSALLTNAYFDNWDTTNVNTPLNWTLANLSPGTSIFRDTDAYSTLYAAKFTGAGLNAELKQPISGLVGGKNYLIGIRIKRPGTITTGVLTLALRDSNGTILTNAIGADLSLPITLTGAGGNYLLSSAVLSVPKNTSSPTVFASIRFTTAMAGGESILVDNFELIPMVSAYPGGPDFGFIPGNIPWAISDTYKFDVTNTLGKTSFIKNLDRVYQISRLGLDIPTANSPTQSDALIS